MSARFRATWLRVAASARLGLMPRSVWPQSRGALLAEIRRQHPPVRPSGVLPEKARDLLGGQAASVHKPQRGDRAQNGAAVAKGVRDRLGQLIERPPMQISRMPRAADAGCEPIVGCAAGSSRRRREARIAEPRKQLLRVDPIAARHRDDRRVRVLHRLYDAALFIIRPRPPHAVLRQNLASRR